MATASDGFEMCDILSVTEESATVIVKTREPGEVTVQCGEIEVAQSATGRIQRLAVHGLAPDTEYALRVSGSGAAAGELAFRTLPAPGGRPRLTFAVVADPHISFGKECSHGRLFEESRQLLRETVEDINAEGADLVILPGDITEDGLEREMREARTILDGLACRVMPAFGDHELTGNDPELVLDPKKQRALWCDVFERDATHYSERHGGVMFVALDTDDGMVDDAQLQWLASQLDEARTDAVMIAAHRNLSPNPMLMDDDPVTGNADALQALLGRHRNVKAVFAGHKNVPTRYQADGAWHFACPQICEFPCGYLMVKVYDDVWTHSFRPIRSDALMDKSFEVCLRSGMPQWDPWYRLGRAEGRNGVQSFNTGSQ